MLASAESTPVFNTSTEMDSNMEDRRDKTENTSQQLVSGICTCSC